VAVLEEAKFENERQRRRVEFAHQWVGNGDGLVINMGPMVIGAAEARREMQSDQIDR
jgi:hypothetical protein